MKGGTKLCVSATVSAMGVVIAVIGVSFLHFFPVIFDETLKKVKSEQIMLIDIIMLW